MVCEECSLYSGEKCMASPDLAPCDFDSKNYKECLRYRLYYLKVPYTQLR